MTRQKRMNPIRLRGRPRIQRDEVASIITLIKHLSQSGDGAITWKRLAEETGRSERNLRRRDEIYEAYWIAKDSSNKPSVRKAASSELPAIADLKRRLKERDERIEAKDREIDAWRRKFVQLVIVGEREGVDIRKLWETAIPPK